MMMMMMMMMILMKFDITTMVEAGDTWKLCYAYALLYKKLSEIAGSDS